MKPMGLAIAESGLCHDVGNAVSVWVGYWHIPIVRAIQWPAAHCYWLHTVQGSL